MTAQSLDEADRSELQSGRPLLLVRGLRTHLLKPAYMRAAAQSAAHRRRPLSEVIGLVHGSERAAHGAQSGYARRYQGCRRWALQWKLIMW